MSNLGFIAGWRGLGLFLSKFSTVSRGSKLGQVAAYFKTPRDFLLRVHECLNLVTISLVCFYPAGLLSLFFPLAGAVPHVTSQLAPGWWHGLGCNGCQQLRQLIRRSHWGCLLHRESHDLCNGSQLGWARNFSDFKSLGTRKMLVSLAAALVVHRQRWTCWISYRTVEADAVKCCVKAEPRSAERFLFAKGWKWWVDV